MSDTTACLPVGELRPAITSLTDARRYLGGIGETTFYRDFLPKLEIVEFGRRKFVTVSSLDRVIAEHKTT